MRCNRLAILGLACAVWGGCAIDDRMLTVRDSGAGEDADLSGLGLVIATFEDGTAKPNDQRFQTFQFYDYNTTGGSLLTSPVIAGGTSNFALGLNWRIIDTPNGHADFPGVGVRTLVNGTVDLSSYSRIVFGLKYAPTPAGTGFGDTASCIADTTLTVSIGCNEYNTTFTKSVLMPPEWKTITMLFADFQEPSYLPATGTSVADCLRLVNGIDFQSQVDLLDGECAAGALGLDDITLRLPPATDGGVDGPSPDASTD